MNSPNCNLASRDARLAGEPEITDPGQTPIGRTSAAGIAGAAAAATGLALILLAAAAGRGWAEAHFLPAWGRSWNQQVRTLLALRIVAASVGLLLVFVVRPRLTRAIAAGRERGILSGVIGALIVVLAAFAVTEGILRTQTWHSIQE